MAAATCRIKHTKYQPTLEEFCCPKCGAEAGKFYISDSEASNDCDAVHRDDSLYCDDCQYATSGQGFISRVLKQRDLVPCPTCRGTGHIKGSKP